jgi:hypothetical protein
MNQAENAALFAGLHVKGAPLLLYNVWDAGSAKAILEAGGRRSRRAVGLSPRRKATEARPSRSGWPSRSSGGLSRPSTSR